MFHKLITFGQLFVLLWTFPNGVFGQIPYTGHLSELRIKELHNLAVRLEHSISNNKHPCDGYYDYVCSRNRPMFSVMGSLPGENELINLLIDLQNDDSKFDAKQKLMNFFLSCNLVKSVDDCYRETFDYFRPVFGYIVAARHVDRHDHRNLMEMLDRFIDKAKRTEHFATHSFKYKLEALRDKITHPQMYFQVADLNKEYANVMMYADQYEHNVRSLEEHRQTNMTYNRGTYKAILDWTMYIFQSRNKPMSYYYATLNVHLWMMFYNSSSRMEQKKYADIADCLKLPPALNVLDEARLLSVIYLKSFQNAWAEYREWITSTTLTQEIYDHENQLLKLNKLNNKRLFFTMYAQNFCDFGRELAENIFFLGLKQNQDFSNVYSCGFQTQRGLECS